MTTCDMETFIALVDKLDKKGKAIDNATRRYRKLATRLFGEQWLEGTQLASEYLRTGLPLADCQSIVALEIKIWKLLNEHEAIARECERCGMKVRHRLPA